MAVTRLKRKGRRNKVVAKGKVSAIQRLSSSPVIRNVDVEAIKEEFKKNASKATPKAEKNEPKAEAVVEEKPKKKAPAKKAAAKSEEKPKAEKKTAAPKKKAAPKAKKEDTPKEEK